MLASAEDASARLLYRISVKGAPCLSLPRADSPAWLSDHIAGAYHTPVSDIDRPRGAPVSIASGAGDVHGDIGENSPVIAKQVGPGRHRPST
jgi:hypothetical protein